METENDNLEDRPDAVGFVKSVLERGQAEGSMDAELGKRLEGVFLSYAQTIEALDEMKQYFRTVPADYVDKEVFVREFRKSLHNWAPFEIRYMARLLKRDEDRGTSDIEERVFSDSSSEEGVENPETDGVSLEGTSELRRIVGAYSHPILDETEEESDRKLSAWTERTDLEVRERLLKFIVDVRNGVAVDFRTLTDNPEFLEMVFRVLRRALANEERTDGGGFLCTVESILKIAEALDEVAEDVWAAPGKRLDADELRRAFEESLEKVGLVRERNDDDNGKRETENARVFSEELYTECLGERTEITVDMIKYLKTALKMTWYDAVLKRRGLFACDVKAVLEEYESLRSTGTIF